MNEQYLLDLGFRRYDPTTLDDRNFVKDRYQKCIKDGDGNKKYYIDVVHYDMSYLYNFTQKKDAYSIKVQVYRRGSHNAINIEFLKEDLNDALYTLDKMFDVGLLEPYEMAGK